MVNATSTAIPDPAIRYVVRAACTGGDGATMGYVVTDNGKEESAWGIRCDGSEIMNSVMFAPDGGAVSVNLDGSDVGVTDAYAVIVPE